MAGDDVPARVRPRVGLVLGAGGVLGAAWMTGALAALEARLPVPAGELEVIVGTSAGSVLAAALRCGFTVEEMVAHQRGGPAGPLSVLDSPELGCGALPPWPRPGVGSPRLLLSSLRAPHRVHPLVLASACLPPGRADHTVLRAMMQGLAAHAGQRPGPAGLPGLPPPGTSPAPPGGRAAAPLAGGAEGVAGGWPATGQTWLVAVDYDSGRRVVFGRRGAPEASLPDAVSASCSIPGWFRPAVIAGRRYVDGGIRSCTSADLLAGAGLDEAYVLAPMASLACAWPRAPLEWAERLVRRWMTFTVRREAARLRSAGTRVTLVTPGPEDLDAMGANLMDPARRKDVFETSVRTSARSLAHAAPAMSAAA